MSAEKRKGDAFERAVVAVLRDHGHPYAERTLRLGAHDDRGDVAGLAGFHLECKNHARLELAGWLDQARTEAAAYRPHAVPVLVVKRRGQPTERAYVVLELADFAEVIR